MEYNEWLNSLGFLCVTLNFVTMQWGGNILSQVSYHHTTTAWTEGKLQPGNLDHEYTGNPIYVAHGSQTLLEEGKGSIAGHLILKEKSEVMRPHSCEQQQHKQSLCGAYNDNDFTVYLCSNGTCGW